MKTRRPDPPPPNPSGMCMCGCGNPVPKAKKTGRGNVRGQFLRYLQGHAPEIGRLAPDDPRGPNPSGFCLCGCGQRVAVADRTDHIKHTVSGCYVRFLRGHDKWRNRPADVVERSGICACGCGELTPLAKRSYRGNIKGLPMLYVDMRHAQRTWYKVDPETGCWNAQSLEIHGYGRFRRNSKLVMAHIWFWEQRNGPLPEGLTIDHLCRNRACVNPDHLEAVTQSENSRRVWSRDELPMWKDARYTIDPKTGCWNFFRVQEDGYGRVWVGRQIVSAHSFFYRKTGRRIPEGFELDHLCRNRGCVNPDHLEPVTRIENNRRAALCRKAARQSSCCSDQT